MKIIGAGMTGCLAGLIFPEAEIIEKQKEFPINHGAVLRFRDESVSKLTGIPFRKVTVRKGIYYSGEFVSPNIRFANMYSMKVLGLIADRSIWNLDSVSRYIAPENFQELLVEKVFHKIRLDKSFELENGEPCISTIPISSMLKYVNINCESKFTHQEIYTARFHLSNVDVFQTVYIPGSSTPVYRATITGNNLIIESTSEINNPDIKYMVEIFGLNKTCIDKVESKKQSYGKIAEINEIVRKGLLYELTTKHNVYSAGRYAIWRNILMDDVLQDLYLIKKMIETNPYNRLKLERTNES